MGKFLINLISDNYIITGNSTIDVILFAVIGAIAFLIAFGFVGQLFDFLGFYDSTLMSFVHWSIRVFVFVGLTYSFTKAFQFISLLFSFKWWIYCLAFSILFLIILIKSFKKHKPSYVKFIKKILSPKIIDEPIYNINNIVVLKKETKTSVLFGVLFSFIISFYGFFNNILLQDLMKIESWISFMIWFRESFFCFNSFSNLLFNICGLSLFFLFLFENLYPHLYYKVYLYNINKSVCIKEILKYYKIINAKADVLTVRTTQRFWIKSINKHALNESDIFETLEH